MNLTTFWWSLPSLPLLLLALSLRRWTTALALLVPAGLWLWAYGGLFVPSTAGDGADLRVATFNTFVHAPGQEHVLDLVAENDPDVLVLQEVFAPRWDELESELADRYPTRQWFESPGVGGVAVLSRFPLVGEPRPVGEASRVTRSTRVVVLEVDGQEIQVVPLHLISPCPSCGPSFLERLELEGVTRRAEIAEVLAALDPSLPAVVAGDLNSNDRSDPYRALVQAGFEDPHRQVGRGPGFTWPNSDAGIPAFLRIDWVLARGFEPVYAFVGEGGPSDHRPVLVDLRIEPST